MIYIIILLCSNILFSMDNEVSQLSQKFTHTIRKGSLQEFKELYPALKAKLDDRTLGWGSCICDWHGDAIQNIELMHNNPFIHDSVVTMQTEINNLSEGEAFHEYLKQKEKQYENSNVEDDFKKAIEIVTKVQSYKLMPAGRSIKAILKRYTPLDQVQKEQFIFDEKEKMQAIRNAIQEIYDTEFEPEQEFKKFGNGTFGRDCRRRKEKSADHSDK